MAENVNPLIIPIGADVSQFKYSIDDVRGEFKALYDLIKATPFNLVKPEDKKLLEDYDRTLKTLQGDLKDVGEAAVYPANSIKGIGDRIQELKSKKLVIDASAGEKEIIQLNQEIQRLEAELAKLNKLGVDKGFSNVANSGNQARISLNNLSLVAQDLPFGFIAIQNNIPNLVQSFAKLSQEAKTAGVSVGSKLAAEFKGTTGAILGIGLGISVAVSAVTVLIQKYGSLGAAIDAFFMKLSKFNDIYVRTAKGLKEYNENLTTNQEIIGKAVGSQQGLISKISALSEVVLDVTQSEDTRKKALQGLQEIDKERFKNFDIEKGKYEELKKVVDELTKSILAKATADAFAQQVGAAAVQFEQQKVAADAALKDLQAFENANPSARKSLEKFIALTKDAFEPAQATGIVSDLIKLESRFNKERDGLKSIGDEWVRLNELAKFYAKNASQLSTITPGSDGRNGSAFKFQIEPLAENLSLQQRISLLEKLGTILLDTKSKESDRIQALKELSDLEYDVWGGIKLQDLSYKELRATLTGVGKTYQQLILQENQRRESLRLTEEAIKRQAFLNKEDEKVFLANIKAKREELTKLALDIPKTITVPINFPINQANLDKLAELAKLGLQFGQEEKDIEDREKRFEDSVKKLNSVIENGLRRPFRDFFDELLDNGRFTFDSFVNFAKDAFKRILADLAAAGFARILTSILTGGKSDIIKTGSSLFDAIFGNKVAAPSFGGVGGGPLQMAGAVNLQLRGSDLVASINRTNSTIGRIG